jgi:hypothetical protein
MISQLIMSIRDASVIPSGQEYTGMLVLGYSTYQNEHLNLGM